MPGSTRIRSWREPPPGGLTLGVLLAGSLLVACGSPAPEADHTVAAGPDLADLTGSWSTRVADDEVWQGRWHLHVQGAIALIEGPDHRLRMPGRVIAGARGVVVFGADQSCPEQLAVTPGSYTYEARGTELVFRAADADSCADRLTILTHAPWSREPVEAPLPVRIDLPADPACASVADGTAADGPPRPFTLQNDTAGIVLALRRSLGEEVLLGQALPGEEVRFEPRRGGYWYVADLTGRCLSLVDGADGVTLRTGVRPRLDRT